jgi:hypothetical protein
MQGTTKMQSACPCLPVYNNGVYFVAVASSFYESTDGKIWTKLTTTISTGASTGTIVGTIFAFGLWIIITVNKGIYWSTNRTSWTLVSGTENLGLGTLVKGKDKLLAVGGYPNWNYTSPSGTGIWYSYDGKNWYKVTGETADVKFSTILYKNGVYFAGTTSTSGGIYKSYDGVDWTKVKSGFGNATGASMNVTGDIVILSSSSSTTAIKGICAKNTALQE